jgi:ABC-type amino acid transport system permease subunit
MVQSSILGWAIALILGFPILTIVLGESIHRLKQQGKPIAATLRLVRNLIVPVLVFLLFMQNVLGLASD